MERTDEYRKALDVPISELSIDRIIEEIRRQPENFEALYHLTTNFAGNTPIGSPRSGKN